MDKKEKKEKEKKGKRIGERERERERDRQTDRQRERNKKGFHFSLRFAETGPLVFVGEKGKVGSHIKSYAWVPKSWSFVKLQEVGNFPTWIISSLKAI